MIIEKSLAQENIVQLLVKLESASPSLQQEIKEEIDRRNLSAEEIQRTQKEYSNFKAYVEGEANKPLPTYLKVACVFVPFIASKIFRSEDLPEREIQRLSSTHNVRQKKEIFRYSTIGLVIYMLLFLIATIVNVVLRFTE